MSKLDLVRDIYNQLLRMDESVERSLQAAVPGTHKDNLREAALDLGKLISATNTLLNSINNASEQITPDEDEAIRDIEAGLASLAVSTGIVWVAGGLATAALGTAAIAGAPLLITIGAGLLTIYAADQAASALIDRLQEAGITLFAQSVDYSTSVEPLTILGDNSNGRIGTWRDDEITSTTFDDTADLKNGNDTYFYVGGSDQIYLGDGLDTVSYANYSAGIQNGVIDRASGNGVGPDIYFTHNGERNFFFDVEILELTEQADDVTITTLDGASLDLRGGDDTVHLYSTSARINGGSGIDTITSLEGLLRDDRLNITGGNVEGFERFIGGVDGDTIELSFQVFGGFYEHGTVFEFDLKTGDDILSIDSVRNISARDLQFNVDLGEGNNTFEISGVDESVFVKGGTGIDTIDVALVSGIGSSGGRAVIESLGGDDIINLDGTLRTRAEVRSGDGNDTITVRDGHTEIWGEGGDDTIVGGRQADEIYGGDGRVDW